MDEAASVLERYEIEVSLIGYWWPVSIELTYCGKNNISFTYFYRRIYFSCTVVVSRIQSSDCSCIRQQQVFWSV
jgi:hypothetical protein